MSESIVTDVAPNGRERRMTDASERLIVALDVPSVAEAQSIVDDLDGVVSFYKIGLHLQWGDGVKRFIGELIARRIDIFIDYKYSDIGESMRGGISGAAQRRIKFITIQGNGEMSEESMRAAVAGKNNDGLPKIFFVTLLTSLDENDLRLTGRTETPEQLAIKRAEMAVRAGLDGVIASGLEARAIRDKLGNKLTIISPGIRPAGASHDDQKRVATPRQAIEGGADYLVVGRPIIRSDAPADTARMIVDEMQAAFDLRTQGN